MHALTRMTIGTDFKFKYNSYSSLKFAGKDQANLGQQASTLDGQKRTQVLLWVVVLVLYMGCPPFDAKV